MLMCRRFIILSIATLVIGLPATSCNKQGNYSKQVATANRVKTISPPAGSTAAVIYSGSTFSVFDGVIPDLWPSQIYIPDGGHVRHGKITNDPINSWCKSVVRSSLSIEGVVETKPKVLIAEFRDIMSSETSYTNVRDSETEQLYELEYLTQHSGSYLVVYVKVYADSFWPGKGCYLIWLRELEDRTPDGLQNIKDIGFVVPIEETT